jgi:hypothetical protein
MKLEKIINIALSSQELKNDECFNKEYVVDLLKNNFGPNEKFGYWHNDQFLLSQFELEESFQGTYFLFISTPHYPSYSILSYDKLIQVDSWLISEASILNPFTGFALVIHSDSLLKYSLFYEDENRNLIKFNKPLELKVKTTYKNPKLNWV